MCYHSTKGQLKKVADCFIFRDWTRCSQTDHCPCLFFQTKESAPPSNCPRVDWEDTQFVREVSPAFLKLTGQVKSGYTFDTDAIRDIKCFLERLHPLKLRHLFAKLLIYRLVPTRENDSKGFAEHMLILLTAPNAPELHKPALKLLRWTLWDCTVGHLEDFARSNFFLSFPLSFQEDPIQLQEEETHMMDILYKFTEPLTQLSPIRRDHLRLYGKPAPIDLFVEKVFTPLRPLFEFICRNRLNFYEYETSGDLSSFVDHLTEIMPSTAKAYHFLSSIHFCFASLSWLNESEPDHQIASYLGIFRDEILLRQLKARSTHQRTKDTITELTDEGHADFVEIRLHWVPQITYPTFNKCFSRGIIKYGGGNVIVPEEFQKDPDYYSSTSSEMHLNCSEIDFNYSEMNIIVQKCTLIFQK
ncbi:hypothetical protein BLNAU_13768 [Blattamonas nauphoetae]|uniref:Uncharacterized protein n=1 Tax=Blattamonas nauphoetae TaxID=2049346 RepID=A0ABQ9XLZ2_9EUKA|nr:hypothetical protein BLNAU_13768 [Blattamonas nauphoetae]